MLLYVVSDCSVCQPGYAPVFGQRCRTCDGKGKQTAMAVSAIVLSALVVVVCFIVADLVQVIDPEPTPETKASWRRRLSAWRVRVVKKFPRTAVKIVLVVWQIITQVWLTY